MAWERIPNDKNGALPMAGGYLTRKFEKVRVLILEENILAWKHFLQFQITNFEKKDCGVVWSIYKIFNHQNV